MKKVNPLVSIMGYSKGCRKWLVIGGLFSLGAVLFDIALPYLYRRVVDLIVIEHNSEDLIKYISFIIVLLFCGTLAVFVRKFSAARYTTLTIKNLREGIGEHIQKMQFPNLKKHHSGDLSSRVNDDIELIRTFLLDLSDFIYQPLIFVLAFIYGLILSWKLLIVTLLVLALAMFLNEIASTPLSNLSKELQKYYAKCSSIIQDTVKGISMVKAFNLEDQLINQHNQKQLDVYGMEMKIVKQRIYVMLIMTLLMVVPIQVINLYGGRLAFLGEMTVGQFTAFVAIRGFLTSPISRLISLVSNYKLATGGAERINEILSYPLENYEREELIPEGDNLNNQFSIEFKDVSFSYENGLSPVIENLSFVLEKNKTIALVGASGGGKSTILNLLCGLYDYYEGEINILGNKITASSISKIRSYISLVSQDAHIYPKTVAQNIGYGKNNSTKEEIIAAAKLANAHEFIMNLPQGYETLLTEGGGNLSGGQKQRLTIARAVLKNTPILLLDEPTSALDSHSEKLITESLTKLKNNRSVIIVAHRLSTIQNADEILVLQKGSIVERGSHGELMKLDGIYKGMYLKQQEESTEKVGGGAA